MLTRVSIDNYRCFQKFEFKPQPLQLIVGRNGAGKSGLMDALHGLRRVLTESRPIYESFGPETKTRWAENLTQSLEVEVSGNGGLYAYGLTLRHGEHGSGVEIFKESLHFDDKPVYVMNKGAATVYDEAGRPKTPVPVNAQESGFARLFRPYEPARARWFKDWLAGMYCIRPVPGRMETPTRVGVLHPQRDLTDFASWYLHSVLERTSESLSLRDDLRAALDGFDSLAAKGTGQDIRLLRATFRSPKKTASDTGFDHFDFHELSDGQRTLIALYSVIHFAMSRDRTILFDEPDNFISLAEIQPWLLRLMEQVEDGGAQAIIVSHHPELLNQLAPRKGVVFDRRGTGPVKVSRYKPGPGGALTPADDFAMDRERA